jgi:hypothetical protein
MKVQVRILLTTCLASSIASCGVSIQSESALTPGVDLGSLQTFAWDQEMDLPSGDPRLENNHFFLDRMHEAIEWELSLSGFRHDESSPDLLLHHHLTLADHGLPADSVIDDSGFVTTRPYSYEEGTVMVHAADPETSGSRGGGPTSNQRLLSPDAMRTWVYSIVREMFRDWPVPGRTNEE